MLLSHYKNQPEAGLAQSLDVNELEATTATEASAASQFAANDTPLEELNGMTQEDYDKALDMAKLSSQAYDRDDFAVAEAGMALFSGIDDIREQEFDTPNYQKIDDSGNAIDWVGRQRSRFGL